MKLIQSRNITDYKQLMEEMIDDFGVDFYPSILNWCGIINTFNNNFWQMYLIQENNEIIGMCGLYALNKKKTDELWLGWFGILPDKQGKEVGSKALKLLEQKAKEFNCKKLCAWISHNSPEVVGFYKKNDYNYIGTVLKFLHKNRTKYKFSDFDNLKDFVIEKK